MPLFWLGEACEVQVSADALTVELPGVHGGWVTVIVKVWSRLVCAGVPLSVTLTVTVFVPVAPGLRV